jgi:membrane protease YdiL (CAAX protease family)
LPRTYELRAEPAKIGAVLGLYILALLLGLLMAPLGFLSLVDLVIAAVFLAGLYGLTRIFRGPSEPPGVRRPWWRLTERPIAGYLWTALFGVRAVTVWATNSDGALLVVLNLVAAAAFLGSSIRLTARRPEPRAESTS